MKDTYILIKYIQSHIHERYLYSHTVYPYNIWFYVQIEKKKNLEFSSNLKPTISYFQFSNYETVAEGYGGKGLRLDRTNEDIIPEILEDAVKLSLEGHSVLVNALIGKTNFREGSISV